MAAGSGNTTNIMQNGGLYDSPVPGSIISLDDYASVITLAATTDNAAGDKYYSFANMRSNSVGGTYQVPSGKVYFAVGFYINSNSGSAGWKIQFGYGTSTFTTATTSAPTGAVYYQNTAAAAFSTGTFQIAQPTIGVPVWVPLPLSFPALSFPFFANNQGAAGSITITLVGQEL